MSATPTFVTGEPPAHRGPARSRRQAMLAPLGCGCALLAGAVYVAAIDPSDGSSLIPPCPFRTVTGLWCPGCGLTRATHHLLRGDLVAALRFNVLVLVVLAAVAVSWTTWTADAWRGGTQRRALAPRWPVWTAIVFGAAALVFAVVRNLPGVTGLRG